MRLGTMLGAEANTALKKHLERSARAQEKRDHQLKDAERNRKRQRGEIIRYAERDR